MTKETKPARNFVAKALPRGDGFVAQWAAPGLIPRIVTGIYDEPAVYQTAAGAEAEARRVLFNALNSGPVNGTKNKMAAYETMSSTNFANLMSDVDISPAWFAYIMATNFARVKDWMTGAQTVSHAARVMLEIFKQHPEAMDTAEAVTRSASTARVRKPSRQEPRE